ncbi:MAG: type II secretion system protein GspN [Myxococcaceae bacterium]
MPTEHKIARWKIIVGYVAFSVAALLVCLYLTFPYDAVRERVQREADGAGLYVKMGSLGPGLRGITASNVQLSKKMAAADTQAPEPLMLKSVSVRPTLFPPGLAFHSNALGGRVAGSVGALGDPWVRLEWSDVDLSQGNLKAFSGVDLSGKASGQLSLDIPRATLGGGKTSEPDLGQASGSLKIAFAGVTVNGGTINVAIPMYGPEPTPVDLPKIVVGDIDGAMKFEKGAGTIERLTEKGQGLEVAATGTLKLAKRLEYAEPNIEIRLKTEPEFVKSLGIYSAALMAVGPDPKDPAWRMGRVTGMLGRPNFR